MTIKCLNKFLTEAQTENGNKYLTGNVSLLVLPLPTPIIHRLRAIVHQVISANVMVSEWAVAKEAKHAIKIQARTAV